MASLRVRRNDYSATKQRAIDDAKNMQLFVFEQCKTLGKEIPQYHFSELIGKGSYGRVYKAKSLISAKLVAIKIIDIEAGDISNPRMADTYNDLMKEINALQSLGDSGAKNINHVIEAIPVGQSMWVVTEYCAGGSVSTLMRPNAPDGLHEKWIIPILREVAEALRWVHRQGIIHRDLKGANVLVTEEGNVQLCDFGVAGVIATKFDKRTTMIGTPHWMAPELFDETASYGTEVDIWAFGAMAYELAFGQPPNVAFGMDITGLGTHLKHHSPRLDGNNYSAELKDIVAHCLQGSSAKRPNIEQVQQHRYIFNTEENFPTSSLSHLVRAFKLWESQGGDRRSLFSAGGAQGIAGVDSTAESADEWNFSTTVAFEQHVFSNSDSQDVYNVYGSDVEFNEQSHDESILQETPKARRRRPRRRPPPQLPMVKGPLEKLFDPNTISSYDDNSRRYYGRFQPVYANDLPLRDEESSSSAVRESLIDLDASLGGSELSQFVDLGTIRPSGSNLVADHEDGEAWAGQELSTGFAPANLNRRTQDWKFPVMAPLSANLEAFSLSFDGDSTSSETLSSANGRSTEVFLPLIGLSGIEREDGNQFKSEMRASVMSLIDLDLSFAAPQFDDDTRPSTSHSDAGSISYSDVGVGGPFDLEKHASPFTLRTTTRDQPIGETTHSTASKTLSFSSEDDWSSDTLRSTHPKNTSQELLQNVRPYSLSEFADVDPEESLSTPKFGRNLGSAAEQSEDDAPAPNKNVEGGDFRWPHLPDAPAPYILQGQATQADVKSELRRMAMSLSEHLTYTNDCMGGLHTWNPR